MLHKSQTRGLAKCTTRMNAEGKGFGVPSKKEVRKPSKGEQRRKAASDRYDKMAAAGFPEYTVWLRLKEVPDAPPGDDGEQAPMPWLPAGCISVPRSNRVAKAIFDAEEDLMQGAIRLYPNLKKQPRDNIEFGYQLREFDDEEIRTAERESEKGLQAVLRNFFRAIQDPMNPGR